jgi:hypothetical protein
VIQAIAQPEPRTAIPTNCCAPTVRRPIDARLNKEVADMYFAKTKFAHSTVGATLLVALSLSTPVFAADPTLTNNERAAQSAIAYSPIYGRYAPSESADATLANNEDAAQHAISNTSAASEFANFRIDPVSSATSEATLIHNELSAQHAIVEAQAPAPSRMSVAQALR